jgi:CHAT domain-containing protein
MPIATGELKRGFIVVDEWTTVREVRDQVDETQNKWTYIIVRLDSGQYAVLRLDEIIQVLKKHSDTLTPDILGAPLGNVPDLLAPRAGDAVEQASMGTGRARQLLTKMPGRRLVVLAEGEVVGLMAEDLRSAEAGVELDWLDQPLAEEVHESFRSEAPIPKGPGLLEDEYEEMAEEAPPIDLEPEQRWINAEIQDHDPAQPLQMGEEYTLAFDVDTDLRTTAVGGDEFRYHFQPEEDLVELTIQLSSDDFEIYTKEPQKLRVPRTGKSKNRARFDIEPKHEGEGVINAVFLKGGNFIQLITLKLNTGAPDQPGLLTAETSGRPLDGAFAVQPRDVNLTFVDMGTGFQIIVAGAVTAIATLPITLPQLDQMIAEVRQELLDIVKLEAGTQKTPVYQVKIDIPPQVNQVALQRLAMAGYRLYQQIFYGPAAGSDANLLGDRLRQMAQQDMLRIQIVSKHFMLPWAILYMADEYDPGNIDPELFLGLKHIIEHIPLQQTMQVISSTVESRPSLTVSLNVNTDIDQQMKSPLIANQLSDWEKIGQSGSAQVIVRKTKDEVTQALADTGTLDQILYFYCHADSKSLAEGGGPDDSTLVLSNKGRLTLKDLYVFAPTQKILPGAPLVFINACESAELSPLFYDGFAPYFMAKGARGVIGTECKTPALFAAEWAKRFFTHFLAGKSLGQTFLDLRQEFYYKHNNIMGLLYALYCDGDTLITPGMQVE